jgi:hypothetical protein
MWSQARAGHQDEGQAAQMAIISECRYRWLRLPDLNLSRAEPNALRPWGRNRHSDNEKFCNDLNEPKPPKMSERPLETRQDFPTSKLNTAVRFRSPAPNFHWHYNSLFGVMLNQQLRAGCPLGCPSQKSLRQGHFLNPVGWILTYPHIAP